MTLEVAGCTRKAAEHAVTHWHYSGSMPSGKLVRYGVWEDGRYIGAVLFGRGASQRLLLPYGLTQAQGCELVRVALREHAHPVSEIVAAALRRLRASNPGLRIVLSFADPQHNHHGGIYQAGNWLYLGMSEPSPMYTVRGRRMHGRSCSSLMRQLVRRYPRRDREGRVAYLRRVHDPHATYDTDPGKHRYAYPLDRAMRRKITKHARAYPSKTAEP